MSGYDKSDDSVEVDIFVNWADEDKPIELNLLVVEIDNLIPYVTRDNSINRDNLTAYRALSPNGTIAIPARSVVTMVVFLMNG